MTPAKKLLFLSPERQAKINDLTEKLFEEVATLQELVSAYKFNS